MAAQTIANGSAGGILTLLGICWRVVFPRGKATREMWAVPASGRALFASGSAGKFNSPGGVNRNDKDFPWLLAPTNFDN